MNPILSAFDQQFVEIDQRSRALLVRVSASDLLKKPRELTDPFAMFSVGEYIVRSGAMVEQTFGGITTRLWDDPYEWTLPEKLSDHSAINEYLDEVEDVRRRGLGLITSDSELAKQLPAPVAMISLAGLLSRTIGRASHYQGRAFAVLQMISDEGLPRI